MTLFWSNTPTAGSRTFLALPDSLADEETPDEATKGMHATVAGRLFGRASGKGMTGCFAPRPETQARQAVGGEVELGQCLARVDAAPSDTAEWPTPRSRIAGLSSEIRRRQKESRQRAAACERTPGSTSSRNRFL